MTKKSADSSSNTAKKRLEQTAHHWEQRLTREGMPAELGLMTEHIARPFWISADRPKWYHPFQDVADQRKVMDDVTESIFDTPNAEYWRKVSHAANALPATWKGRAFIVLYAELGNLAEAAVECGMSREKARLTLQRFAKYCTAVKPRRA